MGNDRRLSIVVRVWGNGSLMAPWHPVPASTLSLP